MIIYQLHECRGEWQDSRDNIIGSYLRRERAEEEKIKEEIQEKKLKEQSDRCWYCPFLEEPFDNLDNLMSEYSEYCDKAELENEEGYGIDCANYYSHWDDAYFYIKEVEVEE